METKETKEEKEAKKAKEAKEMSTLYQLKPLIDSYFEFIVDYPAIFLFENYKEKEFIDDILKKIINVFDNKDTISDYIFSIYPSFFVRDKDKHIPIGNDMTILLGKETDKELQKRIALHVSYYNKEFRRFSRELIDEKVNDIGLSFFVLEKKDDSYVLQLGVRGRDPIDISFTTNKSVEGINNCQLDYRFKDEEYNKEKSYFKSKQIQIISTKGSLEGIIKQYFEKETSKYLNHENLQGIKDCEKIMQFLLNFDDTFYAHLQMLDKAKMIYVFSQTSQDIEELKNGSRGITGYGGLFILFSPKIKTYQTLQRVFQLYSDVISTRIGHNVVKEQIHKHAVQTALAQVMARNLSHNIGSHVLVKAVNAIKKVFFEYKQHDKQCNSAKQIPIEVSSLLKDIDSLFKEMKTKRSDCCPDHSNALTEISKHVKTDDECIQLIISLLNYIKVRMDYIADITTSTPVMENTKSFRGDVMDGVLKNRLIIDTISGVDNFTYSIKIHNLTKIDGNENDDVQLSIPNDVLGHHAFYVILENLIRNTAKHGNCKEKIDKVNNVIFEIRIEETDEYLNEENLKEEYQPNEFYAVSIVIKQRNDILANKEIIKSNYEREHQDKTGKINNIEKTTSGAAWIAFEQNEIINRSILQKDIGQLRHGGWGILEMEASAAYLRKIPKEDIEKGENDVQLFDGNSFDNNTFHSVKGKINILRAYVADDETDKSKKYLAYRFFVYKPKEILIVGSAKQVFTDKTRHLWNDDMKKMWLAAGIKVIDTIDNNIVYPQRLVVDYTNNSKLKNNARFSRQILNTKEQIDCSENSNSIKTKLWDEYLKEKRDILRYATLSYKCCHGVDNLNRGYYAIVKEDNRKYLEIQTSDNQQWSYDEIRNDWEKYKWIVSCNAKIKVIDERIQSFALKNDYPSQNGEKIRHYDIYKNTLIFTPEAGIDLNAQNFNHTYQHIIQYIQQSNDQIDFLVIHLGIIEKLIASYKKHSYNKEDANDIEQFIKNVLCQDENGKPKIEYDRVIVISGRGKPQNLPNNIRFLNYSVVAQYLIDRRCKYPFAETIYSARKFNNNK